MIDNVYDKQTFKPRSDDRRYYVIESCIDSGSLYCWLFETLDEASKYIDEETEAKCILITAMADPFGGFITEAQPFT